MRALICGGKNFDNTYLMNIVFVDLCWALGPFKDLSELTEIVSGGAPGADTLAELEAIKREITVKKFPAEWSKYGKSAGPKRNQQMIDEGVPDIIVAFPGGIGTADICRRAKIQGIPVIKYTNEGRHTWLK